MHLNLLLLFTSVLIYEIYSGATYSTDELINSNGRDRSKNKSNILFRSTRYLGLSRRFKLNRRYQECVAFGEVQGHCKHVSFCPMDVIAASKGSLEYLCVIEKTHVGVCCPDDILLPQVRGAQTVRDLPAGGESYDEDDNQSGCGLSTLARSIENPSPSQRWPWISALLNLKMQRPHFCGGALLTDQHILTAAHCFTNVNVQDVRVRLGEYDFRRPNETRYKDFKIKNLLIHPEFEQATYENDLAIILLDSPTPFNSYIWPICLPPLNVNYTDKMVVVAGWGQQYYAGPTSEVLLEVTMPVWDQKRCVDAFVQRISDNNLCAAGYEGDKDSCLGDSGGPLLYQLENKRWITIGIVSWGIGCGNVGQPGIYTRVDKYIPWILQGTISN